MKSKTECLVIFDDREYFGIRNFDCNVVDLYTEKTLQGGFLTVIPISSKEHRDKHPTKAKVDISVKGDWTTFNMRTDWGALHVMKIHNSMKEEIEIAKKAAIDQKLYKA